MFTNLGLHYENLCEGDEKKLGDLCIVSRFLSFDLVSFASGEI